VHQSVAFEKALIVLVVLEVLLEVALVVVQLEGLADVLAVVVEGDDALLGLLGLSSVVRSLQVVLVQVLLHILALLEGSQVLLAA
jgi:hypothetical protein